MHFFDIFEFILLIFNAKSYERKENMEEEYYVLRYKVVLGDSTDWG